MTYIVVFILITEFNFRNRNCVYFFAVMYSAGFKLDEKYMCVKYIKLILNQKIIVNNL